MAPSRVIILGVAVVAAIGAGYVASTMTSQPDAVVMESGPSEPAIELTEVLVLQNNAMMGDNLRGKLSWQSWPSAGLDENFITRQSDPDAIELLQESIARTNIYSGEPLRRSKLIGEGQSFMSAILPAGHRAVATRISAETSAGGFILPNDRVDVVMTRPQEGDAGNGYITETILRNIRVLAIDQAIQEDEEGRRVRVGDTATLELSPRQVEIITVAQQLASGRLTLSLRPVADAQEAVDEGADYLVFGSDRRGTIKMIKSGEVSETAARR